MAAAEKMRVEAVPKSAPPRHKWRRVFTRDQFRMQTMIWPGLILCFIFSYIPMYGIIIAFKAYNILSTVTGAHWVGLTYFREFLNDPALSGVLRNTLSGSCLFIPCAHPAGPVHQ